MPEDSAALLPRIAASSYLNTAPLIWSFISGAQRRAVKLLTDTAPSHCAEMLDRGEVEAALVPIIEYQRIPELWVIPDICVGSHSAVRSVVLVTRRNNLKKIERVALDESSRTSAVLIRIIFREFLGCEPKWETTRPDLKHMLSQADAALVIGDPAMKISAKDFRVFDLATLWHDFTGFGFVFAMWMARADRLEKIRGIDFAAARDEGLEHLDEIASANEDELGLSNDEIKRYLTDNVAFRLDDRMKKGLDRYFELAEKHNLIQAENAIRFLQP